MISVVDWAGLEHFVIAIWREVGWKIAILAAAIWLFSIWLSRHYSKADQGS